MSDDPKLSWQLPFGTTWRSQTAEAWTTRRVTRGWHKKLRMHSEHLEDRVQAPGCKCEALSSNPSTTKKKKGKDGTGFIKITVLSIPTMLLQDITISRLLLRPPNFCQTMSFPAPNAPRPCTRGGQGSGGTPRGRAEVQTATAWALALRVVGGHQ
jgi:hypothetical protein